MHHPFPAAPGLSHFGRYLVPNVIHTSSEDWANIFAWELFRWNRMGLLPVKKNIKTFFDLFSSRNETIFRHKSFSKIVSLSRIARFLEENKSKKVLNNFSTGSIPRRFQRNNSHGKIFAQSSELVWIPASIGSKCSCREIFSVRTAVLYIIDTLGCS